MDLVDAIEESKRLLAIASLKEKQEAAITSFLGGDTLLYHGQQVMTSL